MSEQTAYRLVMIPALFGLTSCIAMAFGTAIKLSGNQLLLGLALAYIFLVVVLNLANLWAIQAKLEKSN